MGFITCLLFLLLGIKTQSYIAHVFSLITAAFLVADSAFEGAPVFLVWTFGLLVLYPTIQMVALRMTDEEIEKKGGRKKNGKN